MSPAAMNKMRQRLDALAGRPVPTSQVAAADALTVLHGASLTLCDSGAKREAWCHRVAAGRTSVLDEAMLAGLPVDALAAAGMKTPAAYAVLISTIYRNET